MCLGIPVKIIEIEGLKGKAEFGGIIREVNLGLVEDIGVGDYVIVHAGFALQKLDEFEAQETLRLLEEIASSEI